MKWDDDLLLEHQPEDSPRGQFQLAMYAVHLSTGHSIYSRQIKAATIKEYVHAVATFLSVFSNRDFRKDCNRDRHMGKFLSDVYRDLQSYEGLPNRREPYTLQMQAVAWEELLVLLATNPAALIVVLAYGFGIGLNCGWRLSEWAQPSGCRDPQRPQLNHLKEGILTRAIVPVDISIETTDGRRATGVACLLIPMLLVYKIFVVYRTQKNGQHGEKRAHTLSANPTSPHDPVNCLYGLLRSFKYCMDRDPSIREDFTPLSVYWDPVANEARLVTADEIEAFMRALAVKTYHFDPKTDKKEIMRWSSHSLRVGGCVLLHAMGFSPQDIKWILRWLSEAFTAYLRNIAVLGQRQNKAFDQAAAMPNYV
jgi:hypothetical protein